jgi:hypothetical protein
MIGTATNVPPIVISVVPAAKRNPRRFSFTPPESLHGQSPHPPELVESLSLIVHHPLFHYSAAIPHADSRDRPQDHPHLQRIRRSHQIVHPRRGKVRARLASLLCLRKDRSDQKGCWFGDAGH